LFIAKNTDVIGVKKGSMSNVGVRPIDKSDSMPNVGV